MKKTDLVPALEAGKKLVVGEFKDWEVTERPDAKRPGEFMVITRAFVGLPRETIRVESFAPKGSRAATTARPDLKSGEKVVVIIDSWHHDKQYGLKVRGEVERLVT